METPSMAAGSISVAPTNLPLPPTSILEQIQDLRDKIDLFCQVGESLGMDAQMILNIEFSVAHGINFVKKVLKEGQVADASSLDSNPLQPKKSLLQFNKELRSSINEAETMKMRYLYASNGHEIYFLDNKNTTETPSMAAGSSSVAPTNLPLPPTSILEQIQDLRNKIDLFCQVGESLGMDAEMILNIEFSVAHGINFVKKVLKEGQVADASSLDSNPLQPKKSLLQFNKELRPSINEAETMKMRYLYVSNGHEIYLLDIKKINEKPLSNAGGAPPLPIIATLNLIEERHPVSVSLFKLGSDAYIIGGRKYNANLKLHGCWEDGCKGTSRDSFRLSFAAADNEDNDTLSLSLSKGVIGKMKRSKISPIVEEINGAIHVFDSTLRGSSPSCDWIFSHEVLCEVHDRPSCWQWRKISTSGGPVDDFIEFHLVVGPFIYALCGPKALLFDSEKREWQVFNSNHKWLSDQDFVETAWDILRLKGEARCVLELGGEENRMYVIIAVFEEYYDYYNYKPAAVAYLVNSSGKVVCIQTLHHFFEGGLMQPIAMKTARLIRADEEGKTMCSLVNASALMNTAHRNTAHRNITDDCLFINTFTVKELTSFDSSRFGMAESPVFAEFICVDIKERYIYKTEDRLYLSLQACFV